MNDVSGEKKIWLIQYEANLRAIGTSEKRVRELLQAAVYAPFHPVKDDKVDATNCIDPEYNAWYSEEFIDPEDSGDPDDPFEVKPPPVDQYEFRVQYEVDEIQYDLYSELYEQPVDE